MAKQIKQPFYMSKTKWSGILTGVGMMIPGIVAWLNGDSFPLSQVYIGITAILAVFGVRDLPILNK